jgi:hypothetical protein
LRFYRNTERFASIGNEYEVVVNRELLRIQVNATTKINVVKSSIRKVVSTNFVLYPSRICVIRGWNRSMEDRFTKDRFRKGAINKL